MPFSKDVKRGPFHAFVAGRGKAPQPRLPLEASKELHRLGEFGYLVACLGLDPSSLAQKKTPATVGLQDSKKGATGYIYRSLRQWKQNMSFFL